MAKGAPPNGVSFTGRHPNGIMGIPYNIVAKTPTVVIPTAFKKHRGFLRNVGRLMK